LRVLKPGGQILIYVWAFEQEQRKFQSQDIYVPWNLQYKYEDQSNLETIQEMPNINDNLQNLENNEKPLDDKRRTVIYKRQLYFNLRYYHVFKEGELEQMLAMIENITVVKSYYDHANWCAII
jgi:hypothetical protein